MINVRRFVPALLLLAMSACTDPATKLPSFDHVPDFSMTDSEGQPFSAAALDGKVWIVDFIYSTCPAECPRMSAQMRKVAESLKDAREVHFLSVSVDPARDTPAKLHAFAARWGGPTPQWHFITGTPDSVHLVAFNTFHTGDVIDKIEHSSKFALVDKHRVIRGYYSSSDPESLAQLRRDAEALRRTTL